jgi:hypothetical protein
MSSGFLGQCQPLIPVDTADSPEICTAVIVGSGDVDLHALL